MRSSTYSPTTTGTSNAFKIADGDKESLVAFVESLHDFLREFDIGDPEHAAVVASAFGEMQYRKGWRYVPPKETG